MPTGHLFSDGLDAQARDALGELPRPCTLAAGEVLIEQGAPVETLHFPRPAYPVGEAAVPGPAAAFDVIQRWVGAPE